MILKLFVLFPLAVVALAAALWTRPWVRPLPLDDEKKARSVIVPLDARDPSALIMGPGAVRCAGPCPTFERPR